MKNFVLRSWLSLHCLSQSPKSNALSSAVVCSLFLHVILAWNWKSGDQCYDYLYFNKIMLLIMTKQSYSIIFFLTFLCFGYVYLRCIQHDKGKKSVIYEKYNFSKNDIMFSFLSKPSLLLQMVCVETIMTGIMDTWRFLVVKWQYRVAVIAIVCSIGFFLGIPCTTQVKMS